MTRSGTETGSAATDPIREAFEKGAPAGLLMRRYKLSRSEAEDIMPEAFEPTYTDRKNGY